MEKQLSYILEWFDKDTGLRYHYEHLWEVDGIERSTKKQAIERYLRTNNQVFKDENATIVVLFETYG